MRGTGVCFLVYLTQCLSREKYQPSLLTYKITSALSEKKPNLITWKTRFNSNTITFKRNFINYLHIAELRKYCFINVFIGFSILLFKELATKSTKVFITIWVFKDLTSNLF